MTKVKYKKYKVALHFLFITEVEAINERWAINRAREEMKRGSQPEETNADVEEIL
jgi:hypothetical protein